MLEAPPLSARGAVAAGTAAPQVNVERWFRTTRRWRSSTPRCTGLCGADEGMVVVFALKFLLLVRFGSFFLLVRFGSSFNTSAKQIAQVMTKPVSSFCFRSAYLYKHGEPHQEPHHSHDRTNSKGLFHLLCQLFPCFLYQSFELSLNLLRLHQYFI